MKKQSGCVTSNKRNGGYGNDHGYRDCGDGDDEVHGDADDGGDGDGGAG